MMKNKWRHKKVGGHIDTHQKDPGEVGEGSLSKRLYLVVMPQDLGRLEQYLYIVASLCLYDQTAKIKKRRIT